MKTKILLILLYMVLVSALVATNWPSGLEPLPAAVQEAMGKINIFIARWNMQILEQHVAVVPSNGPFTIYMAEYHLISGDETGWCWWVLTEQRMPDGQQPEVYIEQLGCLGD